MCLESHSRVRSAFQRSKVVSGHTAATLAKLGFGTRSNSALFAAHTLAESSPGTDRAPSDPLAVTNLHSEALPIR